ncbi:hypothetical protein BLNAU_8076 [Blattamonas nauphoetae]|uniref:Uncharacterized protein n=1 Tax=Blattamonas nauphoetae TaxID=2049346 RepID=A0ABQ9XZT0_9EUKA|nr:hypothetical protein BLNAU_8076 [Blattamonas nauphoetae]
MACQCLALTSRHPHICLSPLSLFTFALFYASTTKQNKYCDSHDDSITNEVLRKGCVSLFEHVGSGTELSPSEVYHAIRFLEYTTMHLNNVLHSFYRFFRDLFGYETLSDVALAFFSTGSSHWMTQYSEEISKTDFFSQLLSLLKPHEIPFSDATINFHRHVTSIMLHFIDKSESLSKKTLSPETVASILQAFCPYLRHLLVHPSFFPWKHLWMTFDTIAQRIERIINSLNSFLTHPELVLFVDELENTLSEELASLIGLADQKEITENLLFGRLDSVSTSVWVKGFECLLAHADEGRQFSDVGLQSILIFLKRRPGYPRLVFADDGTFTIREKDELVSSSKHDVRSLWTLLTPTQPQHATITLAATELISDCINTFDRIKHFWNGWLSRFFNAVNPSHLPITPQYHSLHAHLVDMMREIISWFGEFELNAKFSQPTITRKYLVHLSHNAFGNHPHNKYTIHSLLSQVMRFDLKTPTTEGFRRELKEEMISSGLASSSPPFILTAELVCALSDCETMDVVDRTVGLLDRDCSLDDSTIVRMCVFIDRHNTRSLQLAFRSTGRTKEEYFHAFESFLSLHIESFDNSPISSLLSPRRDDHEPTLDEWDEADLEAIPIVMRMKNQNQLSIDTDSNEFQEIFINFVVRSLQQARHCATRLTRTPLERLIAPSIDCLNEYFQFDCLTFSMFRDQWQEVFQGVCSVWDQPVVARAISKTGLFFRIVNGLTQSGEVEWSMANLMFLINFVRTRKVDREKARMLRRGGFPLAQEEGLEDLAEFRLLMKPDQSNYEEIESQTHCLLKSFGTNIPALHSDDARNPRRHHHRFWHH